MEAERRNMCDAIKEIFAEEFNAYMEKGKAEGKIEQNIRKDCHLQLFYKKRRLLPKTGSNLL